MVYLTSAEISDAAGGEKILDAVKKRWSWLKHWIAGSNRANTLKEYRHSYQESNKDNAQ